MLFKKMKVDIVCYLLLLVVLALTGCNQVRKITDVITNPTARELYGRNFPEDSQDYINWQRDFELAIQDSLMVNLPYLERGSLDFSNNRTLGYRFHLNEGSVLHVETDTVGKGTIFLDLFQFTSDSLVSKDVLKSNEPESLILNHEVQYSGSYQLVVQPAMSFQGSIDLRIYTTPSFAFPVVGIGAKGIQSFWGASRDGGSRSHEGVDIFAPRGTPVIAISEGRISYTGNRGLGGKQVWLREGIFGKSIYYAHLDSILTRGGSKVQIGDTLGLIGNTGNARTTAPHLHLGIYANGRGAINPLPFIRPKDTVSTPVVAPVTPRVIVSGSLANLRQSPTIKGHKIGTVKRNDTLVLLGNTSDWSHVRLSNGQRAFIHQSLIGPL